MTYPLVNEIPYLPSDVVFEKLGKEGTLFLDSARQDTPMGRYSFIAYSPFHLLTHKNGRTRLDGKRIEACPFSVLEKACQTYSMNTLEGLPPFQGGLAGMFGYELGGVLETLPKSPLDDLQVPDLIVGFYDCVLAWDHLEHRAWVFSSGFPEKDEKKRLGRAQARLDWVLKQLALPPRVEHENGEIGDIHSTFSSSQYEQAVSKVIDYIKAGDIFEANISQRFSASHTGVSPVRIYQCLRKMNPAPFACYMQYQGTVIASASPERFLKCQDALVETRPIKGTSKRHSDPIKDKQAGENLLKSEKDRAENIMIVDLMRNDLSRVCLPHSIKVPQLCALESFATVHHLVSVVNGTLKPEYSLIDLLKATFPGGSITGAPKIRTMEIIAEIEPVVRGPYCGSMGYIGFNKSLDLSITIRTIVMTKENITFHAGGAITLDSNPTQEYLESNAKAAALKKTLLSFTATTMI